MKRTILAVAALATAVTSATHAGHHSLAPWRMRSNEN
jgi:hypothetical protein